MQIILRDHLFFLNRTIQVASAKVWNKLPNEFKTCSLNVYFKKINFFFFWIRINLLLVLLL